MIDPNNVLLAGIILPVLCSCISLPVFLLSLYTFKTTSFKVKSVMPGKSNGIGENYTNYLQKKSVLMIVLCAFFSFLTSMGVMSYHIWSFIGVNPIDAYYCTAFIPKASSSCYIFGNAALYQFFNARSECVKTAADSLKAFKFLRLHTKVLSYIVPFMSIFGMVFWGGELVNVNGKYHCVDSPIWQLAITFSVLAANTSILFLMLFIWPLRMHYKMMEKNNKNMIKSSDSDSSKPLIAVIKKNLILSSIAISSTMFSMIFMSVLGTDPRVESYAHNLSPNFAQADLCINLICMTLMTSAWIPPILRKRKKTSPASVVVVAGNGNGIGTGVSGNIHLNSSNNEGYQHQTGPNSTSSFQ